ncbi:MAG: NYN domain-containing protein [Chloroflexi bacterium]|nr:NYN domain-containing protein [Chloroflexota bacterium]
MNVIGSRPTGWWRDRDGAVRALVAKLQLLVRAEHDEVSLFVDGWPVADLPEGVHGGVEVLYASRRGANAADDRIVEFVGAHDDPGSLDVITSDRELSNRVRALGARVRGVTALLERLDALEGPPG